MLLSYPNPSSPAQRGREYDGSEPYPQARCPSGDCFLPLARRCSSEQSLVLNLLLYGQGQSGFLESDYRLHPAVGWDHR